MKYVALIIVILLVSCKQADVDSSVTQKKEWAIALHGGAGSGIKPENFPPEKEAMYSRSLDRALSIGEDYLRNGGSAIDAIQMVIMDLEDDSLFNAGKGAVLTSEGHAELDASIMDGRERSCGAVTGLQNIKNPIGAARLVMDSSEHVFFSGIGARIFAMEHGLEWVDSTYFITKSRMARYEEIMSRNVSAFLGSSLEGKFGTVGCVALDKNGNLAAGTSTGGMMMKRHGRIGDSPVIGAGTYADGRTCAVSCTGWGEYFIKAAVAHDIHAQMLYGNQSLASACSNTIREEVGKMGGDGGVIAVDRDGNVHFEFNTEGMFRACADSDGKREVTMFGKD